MYSLKDTKNIYNLAKVERKLGVEFGELSDIWDYLMLIFSKTAFFSNRITEEQSYISVNYIIDIIKKMDKQELDLIDFHLIDVATFPYDLHNNEIINRLKVVFDPNAILEEVDYIKSFSTIFAKLCGISSASIPISKYRKLDILVKEFVNFKTNDSRKREYYVVFELIIPYLYKHIDEFDENMIDNIFNTIYNESYYLDKIKMNSRIPLNQSIQNIVFFIPYRYDKEDVLSVYHMLIDEISAIRNNIIIQKKVIR